MEYLWYHRGNGIPDLSDGRTGVYQDLVGAWRKSNGDRDADRCAGTVINATIDRMNVTEDETMIAILDYDAYHLLNYLRFI